MKIRNLFRRKTKVEIKVFTLSSYKEMAEIIREVKKIEKEQNCICTIFFDI
ncbi:hypothetical protein [Peptostreptococcus faecalis]|uniref:hypothetical protein n=1 Tax=Peptostreptococcus faecalis TaxID=2045015 RepID=UPI0015E136F5|nr:hypothetical protein [Peptostreptococcus faecalis]